MTNISGLAVFITHTEKLKAWIHLVLKFLDKVTYVSMGTRNFQVLPGWPKKSAKIFVLLILTAIETAMIILTEK